MAALASLIFISTKYFDTSSPVITMTREISTKARSVNLYGKDIISTFSIYSGGFYEPMKMNNFITVRGQIVKKTFDPVTNTSDIGVSKQFSYIPCSEIRKDQSILDSVKKRVQNADLRIFLCPRFRDVDYNVTLSDDPENLISSSLIVKVYPCSLPQKNDCFPQEKVLGAKLTFGELASLNSPSNYDNPIAFGWTALEQMIDVSMSKSFRYEVNQNKIIDDRSFLKKPKVKAEYEIFKQFTTDSWERDMSQLYCTSEMIDADECQEYMEFVYEMSNEVVLTTRRYKKIPVLAGEFGGILKFLTTTFVILSFYYSKAMKSFLFRKVFNIDRRKAKKIIKSVSKSLEEDTKGQLLRLKIDDNKRRSGPEKKIKNLEVSNFLKEIIDSKTDITVVLKMVNTMDLLAGACLQKHHHILLPLLLLRLKQNTSKIDSQEPEPSSFDKIFSSNDNRKNHQLGVNLMSGHANEIKNPARDQGPENKNEDHFKGQRHYNALKKAEATNSLQRALIQETLGYLSLVYEQE